MYICRYLLNFSVCCKIRIFIHPVSIQLMVGRLVCKPASFCTQEEKLKMPEVCINSN